MPDDVFLAKMKRANLPADFPDDLGPVRIPTSMKKLHGRPVPTVGDTLLFWFHDKADNLGLFGEAHIVTVQDVADRFAVTVESFCRYPEPRLDLDWLRAHAGMPDTLAGRLWQNITDMTWKLSDGDVAEIDHARRFWKG